LAEKYASFVFSFKIRGLASKAGNLLRRDELLTKEGNFNFISFLRQDKKEYFFTRLCQPARTRGPQLPDALFSYGQVIHSGLDLVVQYPERFSPATRRKSQTDP